MTPLASQFFIALTSWSPAELALGAERCLIFNYRLSNYLLSNDPEEGDPEECDQAECRSGEEYLVVIGDLATSVRPSTRGLSANS